MTTTLDISEARKQFNRLDEHLKDQNYIVVTRHSKHAFAIVDVDYLEAVLETIEIMQDPDAYAMLLHSLEDIKAGRVFDHEEIKEEFG